MAQLACSDASQSRVCIKFRHETVRLLGKLAILQEFDELS
jgi:hypothetical protein